jgi:heterodisulfide reductase subunit A
MESHPKLQPLESPTAGIYIAGCAQGPKDIPDTVCQANGCAGQVLSFLNRGKVKTQAMVVAVDGDVCKGCKLCEKLCPYGALMFDDKRKIMEVEIVKCKGCGTCAGACPTDAISQQLFTSSQIFAEIEAILQGFGGGKNG